MEPIPEEAWQQLLAHRAAKSAARAETLSVSQSQLKDLLMKPMDPHALFRTRCGLCGATDDQATLIVVRQHTICESCVLTAYHQRLSSPWCSRCDGRFRS